MAQNKNNNMGNQDKGQTDGLREKMINVNRVTKVVKGCLLYTSPSPRD